MATVVVKQNMDTPKESTSLTGRKRPSGAISNDKKEQQPPTKKQKSSSSHTVDCNTNNDDIIKNEPTQDTQNKHHSSNTNEQCTDPPKNQISDQSHPNKLSEADDNSDDNLLEIDVSLSPSVSPSITKKQKKYSDKMEMSEGDSDQSDTAIKTEAPPPNSSNLRCIHSFILSSLHHLI